MWVNEWMIVFDSTINKNRSEVQLNNFYIDFWILVPHLGNQLVKLKIVDGKQFWKVIKIVRILLISTSCGSNFVMVWSNSISSILLIFQGLIHK